MNSPGNFFPAQRASLLLLAALLLAQFTLPAALHAAPADNERWLRDQLRDMTISLRQVQEENVRLRAELSATGKSATARECPKASAKDSARLTRLQSELDAANEQLAANKAELLATQTQLASSNAAQQATATRQATHGQQLQACANDNRALLGISQELIDNYRGMGVWEALRQAEPLTGISRIRREELLQKYQQAIRNADVTDCSEPTTPAAGVNAIAPARPE